MSQREEKKEKLKLVEETLQRAITFKERDISEVDSSIEDLNVVLLDSVALVPLSTALSNI